LSSDFILWQLVDSALPTGGFAHSSGLESAWQHGEVRNRTELGAFIEASVSQLGEAALPFVLAAYDRPEELDEIDKLCHAFTTNHVANRASRAQGMAFLNVIKAVFTRTRNARPEGTAERVGRSPAVPSGIVLFAGNPCVETPGYSRDIPAGTKTRPQDYPLPAALLEPGIPSRQTELEPPRGHFAPVLGASLRQLGISRETAARMFFFGHLRGVLAAAVRLNIVGPMEAQKLQRAMTPMMDEVMNRCVALGLDDIAQPAPLLDLWQAAQERLYSRLFQS